MKAKTILSLLPLALLCGCWTVKETPFPRVDFPAVAGNSTNITVTIRGFDTTLTEYTYVDGYQTVFYTGGPRHFGYGSGMATVHTTTAVPTIRPTDAFCEQAKNRLEDLGFNVLAPQPDYVVEARFSGPFISGSETLETGAWIILSLLTCDHGVQTWNAQLKIHDNRTGRLVLTRDYTQRYEVTGFSPIPVFGISYYSGTAPVRMQCWCLGALTERMMADVASFLTTTAKK